MSPFEALYGYPPPIHVPYFPKDSKNEAVDVLLQDRESMLKLLKQHLNKAQNRMKQLADKKRTEREFQIGDWVYMKLQDYRQTSLHHGKPKLQPRFFGPFQVLDKIGKVAYKLHLPDDARIHDVFHVSLLRPMHSTIPTAPILPTIPASAPFLPQAILDRRMVKRQNAAATQYLVHWAGQSPAEATWEFATEMKIRFPEFFP